MRRALIAGLATLAVIAGLGAAPASASELGDCGSELSVDGGWDQYKGKNVVLVIHGWNGTALTDTADMLKAQLPADAWAVETFSYEEQNADWPDDQSMTANCLRELISQFGAATERSDPSVYIVAHSMGGILARVALDRASNLQYSAIVGGVITVDTPHRGSPWGDSGLAEDLQETAVSVGAASAATCLALHHPGEYPVGCEVPPAISPEIPVLQVAGSATLTRTFFMISRQEVDTDSDGIVWMESQAGYRLSVDDPQPPAEQADSFVVRCDVGWGAMVAAAGNTWTGNPVSWWDGTIAAAIQSGTPDMLELDAAIWAMGGVGKFAPCGHGKMTTNPEAVSKISSQLTEWAGSSDASRASLPDGGKWLWEFPVVNPLHETGEQVTALLTTRDGVVTEFPNSTNLWIPCTEEAQMVFFDLGEDHDFTRMQIGLGVTSNAPGADAQVFFDVIAQPQPNEEGRDAFGLSYSQSNGMGSPRTYDPFTLGDRYIGVQAWNPGSSCSTTERNYAALVQTYVY